MNQPSDDFLFQEPRRSLSDLANNFSTLHTQVELMDLEDQTLTPLRTFSAYLESIKGNPRLIETLKNEAAPDFISAYDRHVDEINRMLAHPDIESQRETLLARIEDATAFVHSAAKGRRSGSATYRPL